MVSRALVAARALRAFNDGDVALPTPATRNETDHVVRFALAEKGKWLYDWARRSWLRFETPTWRLDADGAIHRAVQSFTEQSLQDALTIQTAQEREDLLKFYMRQLRAGQGRRLVEVAQHQFQFATAGDAWDPHPFLLACPNGVLDLQTMDFRDGEPADMLTKQTKVPYDACASAPTWQRFVLQICDDNEELAGYLKRTIGYALTGDVTEQCFWIFHGTGSNGKTTFLELLTDDILPEHSWAMNFPSTAWSESMSEYQRASLVGRRLVIAKETEAAKQLHTEFIKSLTGGDTLNARHPYGRPFTFIPQAKLFLAVNHRPIIRDDTHGMWRRVRLVPFLRTFPVDTTFRARLRAEAPGILNWAVQGAFEWLRDGLQTPDCVLAATATYQSESDHINQFFEDQCVIAEPVTVRAKALYDAYCGWANARQIAPHDRLNQRTFGERIKRDFVAVDGRQVIYRGIGLRDLTEATS